MKIQIFFVLVLVAHLFSLHALLVRSAETSGAAYLSIACVIVVTDGFKVRANHLLQTDPSRDAKEDETIN